MSCSELKKKKSHKKNLCLVKEYHAQKGKRMLNSVNKCLAQSKRMSLSKQMFCKM